MITLLLFVVLSLHKQGNKVEHQLRTAGWEDGYVGMWMDGGGRRSGCMNR